MAETTGSLILAQCPSLKKQRRGEFRGPSPLRPESSPDSDVFSLKIDPDGEHGVWIDHKTGEGGTLYELADRLRIPRPKSLPDLDSKVAYANLDDYAQRHGIPAKALIEAGWTETTYSNRPALSFPTATGTRYRFLDGRDPRYKSPPGFKASFFGLERALALAAENQIGYLVAANGEISVLAAQYCGVPAFCVAGGSEKRIPDHLLPVLQQAVEAGSTLLVALDCDDKGRKAAPDLVRQLADLGYKSRPVDLKLGNGGDLADFCRLHQERAVTLIPALPDPPQESSQSTLTESRESYALWRLVPAAEVMQRKPIKYLLKGKIPEAGLSVLFGPSGSSKSTLALGWALELAQSQTVIYAAAEGTYQDRLRAWQLHHQKSVGKLVFFEELIALIDEAQLNQFIDMVLPAQPSLIIFDTLAWVMGGDENSTKDMQALMNACRKIQKTTGAAVLLVHHTNKSGGYRGSSALPGAADSMMEMENDDGVIKLTCFKSKDTREFEPEYYSRLEIETRKNEDGEPVTAPILAATDKVMWTKDAPLTNPQRTIMELLALDIHLDTGMKTRQIQEATQIAWPTLYRTLNTLKKNGYLKQGEKGDPYNITEDGKQRLSPLSRDSHDSNDSAPNLDSHHYHTPLGSDSERESGESSNGNSGNGHHKQGDPWWDR